MSPLDHKNNRSVFSIHMIFLTLCLIGLGLTPFLTLKFKPSPQTKRFFISYTWPGASAKILEDKVTARLEGMFNKLRDLQSVSSISRKNQGTIELQFNKDIDIQTTRFEIANIIRQTYSDLPEKLSYPIISNSDHNELKMPDMTYQLSGSVSPNQLKQYVEQTLSDDLYKIEGVSKVEIYGAAPYIWKVTFDTKKCLAFGITANQIAKSIQSHSESWHLGTLQSEGETSSGTQVVMKMKHELPFQWKQIIVANKQGRIVRLGDIAHAEYTQEEANTYFRWNGQHQINLVIYFEKEANYLLTSNKTKHYLNRLIPELPANINIELSHDAADYLNDEINLTLYRSILSLCILLLLLWFFQRDMKYLITVFSSLLVTLLVSVILFYAFQVELHLISFAGLSISFGLIMDNCLIMIESLNKSKGRKPVFVILAATLTTLSALVTIFFLKEEQKVKLLDFALVIIISLSVSLFVAYSFVPAMMTHFRLISVSKTSYVRKRKLIRFFSGFTHFISYLKRWRYGILLFIILTFGIPVQWLPDKMEEEGILPDIYNKTLGSKPFNNIKPALSMWLGGSLRLFSENVLENSILTEPERLSLKLRGSIENGIPVDQLNEGAIRIEQFLSRIPQLESFNTTISQNRKAIIHIYFLPEYEQSALPFRVKSQLENFIMKLGGVKWSVSGIGESFTNYNQSGIKDNYILLTGYNYDQLYTYAEQLEKKLVESSRINETEISGNSNWFSDSHPEVRFKINLQQTNLLDLPPEQLSFFLRNISYERWVTNIQTHGNATDVFLKASSSDGLDLFAFNNHPISFANSNFKIGQIGAIKKVNSGNAIYRKNQMYRLYVKYAFIGPPELAKLQQLEVVEEFKTSLPIGYQVKASSEESWDRYDESQYWALLIVVLLIFFVTSVLLENIRQPFVILSLIPASFTGLFLTFYLFNINFDQGGYAGMILLCGLTVNSGLIIIDEFNFLQKRTPYLTQEQLFTRALTSKGKALFITFTSTVLGFIPFIISATQEVFWQAFAYGTIGGLTTSFFALLFLMPLFLKRNYKTD